MVFTSMSLFLRSRGPDEFWRKRRMFRLTAHYVGRRRNCYSIAIKYLHRALALATKARQQRRKDYRELWNTRLTGAASLHNITHFEFKEGLERAHIHLDRKSLNNLAIYEPSTFTALSAVAKEVCKVEGISDSVRRTPVGMDLRYQLFMKKKLEKK